MTSLDEGRLLAYLDGELTAEERDEVEALLAESQEARAVLETLRSQRTLVGDALARLDVEPPAERVRAALAELRAEGRDEETAIRGAREPGSAGARTSRARPASWWARRSRLAQAAALLLLLAGGASAALPGSPVRVWLSDVLKGGTSTETVAPVEAASEPAALEEVGVGVRPLDGRIEIILDSVPPESEILVSLVDGLEAAVYGPRGTRFSSGEGRVRAVAPPGGPLRVEVPSWAEEALLTVNGRIYMRKHDGRLDLPEPSTDSSAAEIRFRTRG